MGCCQAKDADKTVAVDSNINLNNGNKKDEDNNKLTVATVLIF